MEIRKPKMSELETIFNLSPKAIYDGTLGEAEPTSEKIEKLVTRILDKGGFYFVAATEEEIKGWILLGTSKDQFTDQPIGFIYELFVLKKFRGQGISKELMSAGISHFREQEYAEVRLSVKAGNTTAIKLYEKMNFVPRTVTMNLQL